jgi:acetyl-CoA synthetase
MSIESVSKESRSFPPPAEFASQARVGSRKAYEAMYARSVEDPEGFWREQAQALHWFAPPKTILEWDAPRARWFGDGKLNISYNCLDRHIDAGLGDRFAFIWEGEDGEVRTLTYADVLRETNKTANALRELGVEAGDRVVIYMGMVPEAAFAMLACTRIGAVHSVIFGGFAADAVRDRVNDSGVKAILTQDGSYRRGNVVELKANVDRALAECPTVTATLVLRRAGNDITMRTGRDHDWATVVGRQSAQADAVPLDA